MLFFLLIACAHHSHTMSVEGKDFQTPNYTDAIVLEKEVDEVNVNPQDEVSTVWNSVWYLDEEKGLTYAAGIQARQENAHIRVAYYCFPESRESVIDISYRDGTRYSQKTHFRPTENGSPFVELIIETAKGNFNVLENSKMDIYLGDKTSDSTFTITLPESSELLRALKNSYGMTATVADDSFSIGWANRGSWIPINTVIEKCNLL